MVSKSRKGQIEVPLNWFYVIIVGGFVIFLFARIGVSNAHNAQQQNAAELTKFFDTAIETYAQTSNTMGNSGLPILSFTINNTQDGVSVVHYQNKDYNLKETVFSASSLKGNISFWTYPFQTGYESSKLLFLTDDKEYYYLYAGNSQDNLYTALQKELPSGYSNYFNIVPTISDPRTKQNSVVACINLASTTNTGSCRIIIKSDASNTETGTITFPHDNKKYHYYNYGMIFAALFSSNAADFENGMKTAILRHNVTGQVLIERAGVLKSKVDSGNGEQILCPSEYDQAITDIKSFQNLNLTSNENPTIITKIPEVNNINRQLFNIGCWRIY